jgi:hypothetical protein
MEKQEEINKIDVNIIKTNFLLKQLRKRLFFSIVRLVFSFASMIAAIVLAYYWYGWKLGLITFLAVWHVKLTNKYRVK